MFQVRLLVFLVVTLMVVPAEPRSLRKQYQQRLNRRLARLEVSYHRHLRISGELVFVKMNTGIYIYRYHNDS